ncbi:XRE family transcriptional regulator, partial [Bacillus subtilis]|nr:XRE family transcriptional regulator [Bacillus subtilis]
MNEVATRDIRVHLKELIKSSGERQNTVAANIGISEGYLSKFLSGKELNFGRVRDIVQDVDSNNETEVLRSYGRNGVKKTKYPAAL